MASKEEDPSVPQGLEGVKFLSRFTDPYGRLKVRVSVPTGDVILRISDLYTPETLRKAIFCQTGWRAHITPRYSKKVLDWVHRYNADSNWSEYISSAIQALPLNAGPPEEELESVFLNYLSAMAITSDGFRILNLPAFVKVLGKDYRQSVVARWIKSSRGGVPARVSVGGRQIRAFLIPPQAPRTVEVKAEPAVCPGTASSLVEPEAQPLTATEEPRAETNPAPEEMLHTVETKTEPTTTAEKRPTEPLVETKALQAEITHILDEPIAKNENILAELNRKVPHAAKPQAAPADIILDAEEEKARPHDAEEKPPEETLAERNARVTARLIRGLYTAPVLEPCHMPPAEQKRLAAKMMRKLIPSIARKM